MWLSAGICGSVLADWETVIHYLLNLIGSLTYSYEILQLPRVFLKLHVFCVCVLCVSEATRKEIKEIKTLRCVYAALEDIFKLISGNTQDPAVLAVLDKQQQRLEGDELDPEECRWTSLNSCVLCRNEHQTLRFN